MDGRQNLQANIMHDVVERCRFASKNVTGGSLGVLYYPRNSVANGWQMPCRDILWTSVSGPNKCTPVHVEYTHFYDFYVIDVLQHLYWFIKMSQIIELLHTVVYRSQWQHTVRERERESYRPAVGKKGGNGGIINHFLTCLLNLWPPVNHFW